MIVAQEIELEKLIESMKNDPNPQGSGVDGAYTEEDYANVIAEWKANNVKPEVLENDEALNYGQLDEVVVTGKIEKPHILTEFSPELSNQIYASNFEKTQTVQDVVYHKNTNKVNVNREQFNINNNPTFDNIGSFKGVEEYSDYNIPGFDVIVENLPDFSYTKEDILLADQWEKTRGTISDLYANEIGFDITAGLFDLKVKDVNTKTIKSANTVSVQSTVTGKDFILDGFEEFLAGDDTGKIPSDQLATSVLGQSLPEDFKSFQKIGNLLYVSDGKGGLTRQYEIAGSGGGRPANAIDANDSNNHLLYKQEFKKDLIAFFKNKYNVSDADAKKLYKLYYGFLEGRTTSEELVSSVVKNSEELTSKVNSLSVRSGNAYMRKEHIKFNEGLSDLDVKKYMSLTSGIHQGYITLDGTFGVAPLQEIELMGEKLEDDEVPFLSSFYTTKLVEDENGVEPGGDGYIPTKKSTKNYDVFKLTEEDAESVFEEMPFGDYYTIEQIKPGSDILKFTHDETGETFELKVGGKGVWGGWDDLNSTEKEIHFQKFIDYLRDTMRYSDMADDWQSQMDDKINSWDSKYEEIVALNATQQQRVDDIEIADLKPRSVWVEAQAPKYQTDEFGVTMMTVPGHDGYYKTVKAKYPEAIPQAKTVLNNMKKEGTINWDGSRYFEQGYVADANGEEPFDIQGNPNPKYTPTIGTIYTSEEDMIEKVALIIAKNNLTYEYHKSNMDDFDDETGGLFTSGDAGDIAAFGDVVVDDYLKDKIIELQSSRFSLMNKKGVILKELNKYVTTFKDPNGRFEIKPGEETIVLECDFGEGKIQKTVPKRLYDKFLSNVLEITSIEKTISDLSEKENIATSRLDNLDYVVDLASLEYNAVSSIFANLGFAIVDIPTGLVEFTLGWAASDGVVFDNYSKFKKAVKERQYVKTFTTDDNGFLDYMEAGLNATAQAAPIIVVVVAASIASGGAATPYIAMGLTSLSTGGAWKADQLMLDPGQHEGLLYLKATGYAGAEFVGELFKIPAISKITTVLSKSTKLRKGIPGEFVNLTKWQKVKNGGKFLTKTNIEQNIGEQFTTNAQTLIEHGRLATGEEMVETLGGATFVSTIMAGIPMVSSAVKSHSQPPAVIEKIQNELIKKHELTVQKASLGVPLRTDVVEKEKAAIDAAIKEIDAKIETLINEAEANFDKLTVSGRAAFTKAMAKLYEIQQEATTIYNSKTLTEKQKEDALALLKAQFEMLQDAADVFRSTDQLGDVGRLFIEGNMPEHQKEIADLKKRARNTLKERGVNNPTQKQINEEAAVLKNMDLIEADHLNKSKISDVLFNSKIARSKEDGVQLVKEFFEKELKLLKKNKGKYSKEKYEELKNEIKKTETLLVANIKKGLQNGTTYKSKINGKLYTFNFVRNQAENGKTETRTHEEGHAAFWIELNLNPEAFSPMAQAIHDWVVENYNTTGKGLYWKLFGMNPNWANTPEEVVMKFLEEVAQGNVDKLVRMKTTKGEIRTYKRGQNNDWILTKTSNNSFLGRLQGLMNFGMKEATDGEFNTFDFSGADNILDFLIGLGHKIKDGTLTREDLNALKSAEVIKNIKKQTKENVKNNAEITKDDKTYTTTDADQIYKEKGIAATWEIMESYNGYLRGLINVYAYVPDFNLHKDIIFEELKIDSEGKRGLYTLIQNFDSRSADYVLEDGTVVKVLFGKKGISINGKRIPSLKGKDVVDVQKYVTENFGPINKINPVPLSGYIFSILPGRVQEIAERHLPFEGGVVAQEPVIEQTAEPDVEIESNIETEIGKWSQILGITDEMKQQVIREVEVLMEQVGEPKGSKEYRKQLQKAFAEAFKVRIKAIIGTQMSDKFDAWLRSEIEIDGQVISMKDALIDYLAVKYRASFPIMSNDGGRMNVEQSHKAQVETPGAWVSDTEAGNTLWVKDFDVDIETFVDFFVKSASGQVNTRNQYPATQYNALVKALAQELGLDAVMDGMPPTLENHVYKIGQIIDRNPNMKMDVEIPPDFDSKTFEQNVSKINNLVLEDDLESVVNRNTLEVIGKENEFSPLEVSVYLDAYDRGLTEDGVAIRYKQGIQKSKIIPDIIKELYKNDGVLKDNPEALDKLHEDMSVLTVALGPEIMAVLGYSGFGYSLRVMDPAGKKFTDKTKQVQLFDKDGNPVQGDYFAKLEELKAKVMASNVPTNIKLDAVRLMNKNFKLFKSIDKIQKGPGTAQEKYDLIMSKHGAEIQAANDANIELATTIIKTLIDKVGSGELRVTSALHFLQIQTSLIAGFRGLSRLDYLELKDGVLKYNAKGEHIGPNSNTMLKIAELICSSVNFDADGNVVSINNNVNIDTEIAEILRYHTQLLGDEKTMDKMDKKLGKTSDLNLQRIEQGLPKSDQKNIYNLDGNNNQPENAINYEIARNVEQVNIEAKKRQDRIDKRNLVIKNSLEGNTFDLGASLFDFDGTVGESDNVVIATKDGVTKTLDGVQWAEEGLALIKQGWEMDFSDFNNITNGVLGPLWPKLINQLIKYGPDNVYILTARAPEVQEALFDFINKEIDKYNAENGTNVPYMIKENIVGLGDSTGQAKADWIEDNLIFNGFNDIYFVDDMPENVDAVGDMMKQYPKGVIKDGGKSVIVKDDKWEFDKENWLRDLMEEVTGIPSFKTYSQVNATIEGKRKGWFKFMLPPNAQDLRGLLENFIPRGKQHEATREKFEEFIDSYNKGMENLNKNRIEMGDRYKKLKKMMPKIGKTLKQKVPGSKLTYENAVRVYIWSKIMGIDMTQYGLSKGDIKLLTDAVENNEVVKLFAKSMPGVIGMPDGSYVKPSENWAAGNILSDMHRAHQFDGRDVYLDDFIKMKNELFSPQNLIDIEARYGPAVRENLEKILYRMENGFRKGSRTDDGLVNNFMRWINNSVGAIMFTNMRSASLQLLSTFNYINMENNTIMAAAKQFANPKRFYNGMIELYKSEFIQTRLFGNMMGINEKDIARIVNSSDPVKALISHLVNLGMAPTKIADAIAILIGGTPYYLNQIDYYLKEGYTEIEAKKMAYNDFKKATQRNQQSGEEHMTSNLQNSDLGKILFAFKNTPMQYVREINLSIQKIYKGQGNFVAEISNIAYYGVVQSFLFTALQQALFAALDAEDEEWDKKTDRVVQSMIDNILNGMGFGGLVTATIKNGVITYNTQEEKGWNADHTYTILAFANMSPSIGSKLRKIYSAIKTKQIYGDAIDEMEWYDPHNPEWAVTASLIEAFTNVPTSRLYQKAVNVETAINSIVAKAYKNSDGTEEGMELAFYQELALFLGWNTYDLGIDSESKKVAKEIKEALKKTKEKNKEDLKDQRDEEEYIETVVKDQLIENEKKKEKGEEIKEVKCSNFKDGKQCSVLVQNPGDFCSYHDPDQSKNYVCGKPKTRGGTCKITTNNYHEVDGKMVKSGCYLHNEME